ncbi:Predicted integral membrane protein [Actinomyces bovis]|uniref:Predicted integral membrane protein n=1 Tax=Actinomyces bovis TaxID=1658 RepID=A0ABY1VME8_9ACTO|nr:hypothetical protein [Actinomyces bovis]SPT53281.1 Predicted integral membrane protein [Actinomyces bovis]VEG52576.1 Predicted integral membrane protein [Actinomyces israelii]
MTSPATLRTPEHQPERWRRTLQVLAVWVGATALSFLVLRLGAQDTPATPWGQAAPTWLEHMAFWDAGWYQRVLEEGYPATLPTGAGGAVANNTWAFMPLLPYLCLPLMALGLNFYAAGALLSLAASAGAAVVLDRWLAPRTGTRTSLWAVLLLWLSPCAPVLQVPYAESLALLLVCAALLAAERGRFLWAAPLALLAAFSRPVGVPLSAAFGLWWAWSLLSSDSVALPAWLARWRDPAAAWLPSTKQPEAEQPGTAEAYAVVVPAAKATATQVTAPAANPGHRKPHGLLALSILTGCAALSWPAIAALVTGRPDAYTATETAWRGTHLVPFMPWWDRSGYFVGAHLGPLLLLALLGLVALALSCRPLRCLGPAAWFWCLGYTLYLLAFFDPTTSLLRLLLPLAPLAWAAMSWLRKKPARVALLLAAFIGQLFWVSWVWNLGSVSIQWVP